MLNIELFPVTDFQQNCRILWQDGTADALVIDPGGDGDRIEKFLISRKLRCAQIWLTHSHLDHCGGVSQLLRTNASIPLFAHQLEREFRSRVEDIKDMYGIQGNSMTNCPEPTRYLEGEETLEFAGVSFTTLFTPGHSPGHICFYAPTEGLLLAGDTLFAGSIGRTDLPGGNHATLIKSIIEKILTLPDDTRVLSGHGPETRVGVERDTNPFLQG
jgi:glyoxylase-like metal-dependent hydrolase (beta-lactamase superfamily II)